SVYLRTKCVTLVCGRFDGPGRVWIAGKYDLARPAKTSRFSKLRTLGSRARCLTTLFTGTLSIGASCAALTKVPAPARKKPRSPHNGENEYGNASAKGKSRVQHTCRHLRLVGPCEGP